MYGASFHWMSSDHQPAEQASLSTEHFTSKSRCLRVGRQLSESGLPLFLWITFYWTQSSCSLFTCCCCLQFITAWSGCNRHIRLIKPTQFVPSPYRGVLAVGESKGESKHYKEEREEPKGARLTLHWRAFRRWRRFKIEVSNPLEMGQGKGNCEKGRRGHLAMEKDSLYSEGE